jgi:hypothetical protein
MKKIDSITFSMLFEIKKANQGEMLMLDLFILEKELEQQLIICTKKNLFIRNKNHIDIYANSFFDDLPTTQQLTIFTRPITINFKRRLDQLFDDYMVSFYEILDLNSSKRNFPYDIYLAIRANIGVP